MLLKNKCYPETKKTKNFGKKQKNNVDMKPLNNYLSPCQSVFYILPVIYIFCIICQMHTDINVVFVLHHVEPNYFRTICFLFRVLLQLLLWRIHVQLNRIHENDQMRFYWACILSCVNVRPYQILFATKH